MVGVAVGGCSSCPGNLDIISIPSIPPSHLFELVKAFPSLNMVALRIAYRGVSEFRSVLNNQCMAGDVGPVSWPPYPMPPAVSVNATSDTS